MSLLLSSTPAIHRFSGTIVGSAPALTVRCASVQDIAPVLAYAREAGLALGEEGGIVLDLSALNAIHLDAVRGIAWVQPGVRQADLEAVAAEHGLTPAGLRVARVVTADGMVSASEDECVELLCREDDPAVVAEWEFALRPASL